MLKTLKRFFDDINRIANVLAANQMQDVLVTLSPEDRNLLQNFRRRKPKVSA